jgi:hypothetical protein
MLVQNLYARISCIHELTCQKNSQVCKNAVWAHDYQAKEQQFIAEASVVNSLRDNRSVSMVVFVPHVSVSWLVIEQ